MKIVTTTTSNPPPEGFMGAVPIDRETYERELRERQREHLKNVNRDSDWQPCLHDSCLRCHGTGIQLDGTPCIHGISCPCPKCSPR
jgi:hypothetical protein